MRLIDPIELKRSIAVAYLMGKVITIETLDEIIDEQPAIEPKKGKWRRIPMACYGGGTVTEYQCPFCGEQFIMPSNFCQECGADMKGEQP